MSRSSLGYVSTKRLAENKSKTKKSKASVQQSALPPDGSPLGVYPVGSCVFLDVDGLTGWYLIAYRIGRVGNPNVRRLIHPPSSLDWNTGPSRAWEVSEHLVVRQSAWPRRETDERSVDSGEIDPIMGNLRLDGASVRSS